MLATDTDSPFSEVAMPSNARSACPVCGGTDLMVHLGGGDASFSAQALGSSRNEVAYGRILRCRTCTLGFSEMRPSPEALSALYQKLDGGVYQAELLGRRRTALRHLKIVQRHQAPGRLLDVGCASGLFLKQALEVGWEVIGVEPSTGLSAQAAEALGPRGTVHGTTLEEAALPEASFDAVTLWDVLEHVPYPVDFLQQCRALLKPGGHLFVNVPDLDSLQARLLGARWPLYLLEHLNYFNRQSLRRCGEEADLAWVGTGRRPASFSIEYVLYRLAQHRLPGTRIVHRLAQQLPLGHLIIPVPMGERYGVWKRP